MGTGHIDKYPASIATDLKALRMPRQWKIRNLAGLRGVDGRERAITITNQQAVCGSVETNIVGVFAELDRSGRRVIAAVKQSHGSITRVRNIDGICCWRVTNALRFCESDDRVDRFFSLRSTTPTLLLPSSAIKKRFRSGSNAMWSIRPPTEPKGIFN